MDKLREERDKWKARVEYLEEKLSDVTAERDICRTNLSDALACLKTAKQSQREDSDDEEEAGGSDLQDDSEDDTESSSSSSESSDSSSDRKRKKKEKGKKRKSGTKGKKKKAKKSKRYCRQRVGGPGEVVKRYKGVLAVYQTGRNMTKSFQKYGVDRLTIANSAAIAELAIAAPEEYHQVEKGGTVAQLAQRCEEVIRADPVICATIAKLKKERKLLPITKKVYTDSMET